jgi:hypothetical protein
MMAKRVLLFLTLLGAAPTLAGAVDIATSPGPDRVAVTIYRDPDRQPDRAPNLGWLNGYALVSETRSVVIPTGETELRFEGVAGGIIPQSAIVTGLPEGIIERNRDAYLLSPSTLIDRSLGARVHLRRVSRATGAVKEQEAIVRTGAEGAVVMQTKDGLEALRCTGLSETLILDKVPQGLSARPTLSVRARSSRRVTATVTLSYLSSGFDWQADYVASLSSDETRLSLFAWLTLANGDETGFRTAQVQAVAGRLNRQYVPREQPVGGPIRLSCWPHDTTSDVPEIEPYEAEDITVTGSRVMMMAPPPPPPPPPPAPSAPIAMMARQEELGDLKLYRIPEPVTVAARSQKQVALLQRPSVKVDLVYRSLLYPGTSESTGIARRVLITRNRTADGLGLPLPSGRMMVFAEGGPRPILIGQGTIRDRSVGEDVELELGEAPGVRTRLKPTAEVAGVTKYELEVTNDRSRAVSFEAEILDQGLRIDAPAKLTRRNGKSLWAVTIPANGRVSFHYRLTRAATH